MDNLTIKRNEIKLAGRRGYKISEAKEFFGKMTSKEYDDMIGYNDPAIDYHKNMNSRYSKDIDPNDQLIFIYLSYVPPQSVPIQAIKDILFNLNRMIKENPNIKYSIIIVSEASLASGSINLISNFSDAKVQAMYTNELGFDLMKHRFVPEQRIATEERAKEILTNFKVDNRYTLPLQLSDDPVTTHLGGERGNLVITMRKIPFAITRFQPFVRTIV